MNMNIDALRVVSSGIEGSIESGEINVVINYFGRYYNISFIKKVGGWVATNDADDMQGLIATIASVNGLSCGYKSGHYDAIIAEIDRLTLEVRKPLQDQIDQFLQGNK